MQHPAIHWGHSWIDISKDKQAIHLLEHKILPAWLKGCRWFGGKGRRLSAIHTEDIFSFTSSDENSVFHFFFLKTKYEMGKTDTYLLPLSLTKSIDEIPSKAIIAFSDSGWVIDGIYDEQFRRTLINLLFESATVKHKKGALIFERGSELNKYLSPLISSRVLDADQSNSSIIYEDKYFLKIYRKLFFEVNPDVEVVKFLTERTRFSYIPSFAGTFYLQKRKGTPITLGMLQQKITAINDAWSLALGYLDEFVSAIENQNLQIPDASVEQAGRLGMRTAELHQALASEKTDESFIPEHFNDEYIEWTLQNCKELINKRLRLLKDCYTQLDIESQQLSKSFIANSASINDYFSEIRTLILKSLRIRIHGDFHLGQVLFDGKEYFILDFEGEPERTISERKIKHSPLKDVAGMLRSFHYAVCARAYFSQQLKHVDPATIERAVSNWYQKISSTYLNAYYSAMSNHFLFQTTANELNYLLRFHLLEKAVYELGYELNSRPDRVRIPLNGIVQVLSQTR